MSRKPLVSSVLRQSAQHASCMLNIEGVCTMQGCVLCHLRIAGAAGFGQKPPDILATFGCDACHRKLDGNGTEPLPEAEWYYYAMRGMARTILWWHEHGYLDVKDGFRPGRIIG